MDYGKDYTTTYYYHRHIGPTHVSVQRERTLQPATRPARHTETGEREDTAGHSTKNLIAVCRDMCGWVKGIFSYFLIPR